MGMVFIHDLLRCDAFFHGADGDGHTVFITSAHKNDIFFAGSLNNARKYQQEYNSLPDVRYEPGHWHRAMRR